MRVIHKNPRLASDHCWGVLVGETPTHYLMVIQAKDHPKPAQGVVHAGEKTDYQLVPEKGEPSDDELI